MVDPVSNVTPATRYVGLRGASNGAKAAIALGVLTALGLVLVGALSFRVAPLKSLAGWRAGAMLGGGGAAAILTALFIKNQVTEKQWRDFSQGGLTFRQMTSSTANAEGLKLEESYFIQDNSFIYNGEEKIPILNCHYEMKSYYEGDGESGPQVMSGECEAENQQFSISRSGNGALSAEIKVKGYPDAIHNGLEPHFWCDTSKKLHELLAYNGDKLLGTAIVYSDYGTRVKHVDFKVLQEIFRMEK